MSKDQVTGCKEFTVYRRIDQILAEWFIQRFDRARREKMKPYILGAICVWFVCGLVGAVMMGQQRVDVATIVGGPISLWNGLNQPVEN